ncbi:MAG: ImmA/IrrE family metallo-endopeptidase [Pseudanabaena sp. M135S2SP2A07QC]|jgi:Zn-dependent peptidase ImmA (M78 family)|nr:ImmA/IrrE family metallo-endopeptidase [Pseudanabaena sp. M090S1SP2A07QC]MCA6506611.1 ImmA/IrrE family metallo-endopeptidase [Pseudanabaena sp. M172S2SP2A07QC]MCA6522801.1 ImmA/IrrE family metallo-endopeptidase [Pseudanabaena sp. M051S1SP2A07QC]MCA6526970.1 ImmA/IrrE family metallo-endopeptidase [Pseudanabaena sp. M179S2SP2A07QC]MCA6531906.1 ImmA/IrrE family metallo-endopeptidase [Pseudanabaena sp. M125S2SP2A07QC]MCA6536062.1 ImmA/IrrE family metallo-endopeptidase [Pseudanabaena sp. M176S2S
MAVRRKHIRTTASQLLRSNRIESAPVEVEKIAEYLGIKVQYEYTDDELSGFLLRDLSRNKAIIGVNAKHPDTRKRFTVAHELGHFMLHEHENLHIDKRFMIQLRDEKSSKGEFEDEKEANLFAAELLMPVDFIKSDLAEKSEFDLEDEEFIKELAGRYGVSNQAMTFRLAYLGYVQL